MKQIGNVYYIDTLEEFCPCGKSLTEESLRTKKSKLQKYFDYVSKDANYKKIKAYFCECGNILLAYKVKEIE